MAKSWFDIKGGGERFLSPNQSTNQTSNMIQDLIFNPVLSIGSKGVDTNPVTNLSQNPVTTQPVDMANKATQPQTYGDIPLNNPTDSNFLGVDQASIFEGDNLLLIGAVGAVLFLIFGLKKGGK